MIAHQLRRRRRAAVGDRLQRGEVVVARSPGCSISCQAMVGTPPAPCDLLALDQLEGALRRPSGASSPACRRQAAPGSRTAKQPVAWKNGTESSIDVCGASGSAPAGGSPRRRSTRARRRSRRHDVGVDVAMGGERALRLAGRAGGVEDGRVVLGIDRRPPAAASGSGRSIARRPITSSSGTRVAARSACAPATRFERRPVGEMRRSRSSRSASTIATLAPEFVRPYSQLGAGPPGVQRRDDRAGRAAAQNATGHSGKLRMTMATRSPLADAVRPAARAPAPRAAG